MGGSADFTGRVIIALAPFDRDLDRVSLYPLWQNRLIHLHGTRRRSNFGKRIILGFAEEIRSVGEHIAGHLAKCDFRRATPYLLIHRSLLPNVYPLYVGGFSRFPCSSIGGFTLSAPTHHAMQ